MGCAAASAVAKKAPGIRGEVSEWFLGGARFLFVVCCVVLLVLCFFLGGFKGKPTGRPPWRRSRQSQRGVFGVLVFEASLSGEYVKRKEQEKKYRFNK